ncbi:hypothetical protein GCM10010326_11430 [Streptomyces xanthochromogenes]|uniref:Uncharacterized protein n=1 Tax=Streptomyces xanthochromogenes TaxID=67384 RepID=A0ABQ2ZR31_9ACTN|nr:hypothetical protein GCM10010326_11430 [Streptomyces xanthochromogenes]
MWLHQDLVWEPVRERVGPRTGVGVGGRARRAGAPTRAPATRARRCVWGCSEQFVLQLAQLLVGAVDLGLVPVHEEDRAG